MVTSAPLTVLQARRARMEGGAIEYRYRLPDGEWRSLAGHTQISRDEFERDLLDAATRLRQWSLGGMADPAAGEATLSHLGEALSERYLPPEVLTFLFSATTPIAIQTDDPEFPWEALRFEGRTLGLVRPISRLLSLRRRERPGLDRWGATRHALLVGDPTGDHASIAAGEVECLATALRAHHPSYDVDALVGAAAPYSEILARLQRGIEFFHFAGHVTFDSQRRGSTGLLFPDGQELTAETLGAFFGAYAFVFINACASGRSVQSSLPEDYLLSQGSQRVRGLAIPFLEGGAGAFMGTLWPVADTAAAAFGDAFYALALQGVAFGEALRQVRVEWRRKFPKDPTWSAYVLYGDPRLTFDSVRDPDGDLAATTAPADPVPQIHLPSNAVAVDGRMRGARAEAFLRQCVEDEASRLAPSGVDALERVIGWVAQTHWHLVARFDLLTGLALLPGGVVARGLASYGFGPAEITKMNLAVFGKGRGALELPYASKGVASALQRAARIAEVDSRAQITADDLAAGLLDRTSASGSLRLALEAIGCAPRDLLEAGRAAEAGGAGIRWTGGMQSEVLSEATALPEPASDKSDMTPRRLLRDLRAQIASEIRRAGPPPCVGREQELAAVIRILTRPYDSPVIATKTPHVVLRGPRGAGCHTLASALAARLVIDPDAGEFAPIRSWDICAVRVSRDSERIDEWLRAEVRRRVNPTILVIEDLPALLSYPGLPETLLFAARHPQMRLVAVAEERAYTALRNAYPDLARLFNTIDIAPPRPEVALTTARAHVARLERFFDTHIAPDAVEEAVRLAARSTSLALPGAAIALLRQACALASQRALDLDGVGEGWMDRVAAGSGDSGITAPAATVPNNVDVQPPQETATASNQATLTGMEPPLVTVEIVRSAAAAWK